MSVKKLLLIEKSKDDILSDLLMCNAKQLIDYYHINEFKRITLNEFKYDYKFINNKIDKSNLPILLFIDGKKIINKLEGFQYLDLFAG